MSMLANRHAAIIPSQLLRSFRVKGLGKVAISPHTLMTYCSSSYISSDEKLDVKMDLKADLEASEKTLHDEKAEKVSSFSILSVVFRHY
jgi:hypothetical protein